MQKPILVITLLLLAGCVFPTVRTEWMNSGAERASFELDCPKETLAVKGLTGDLDGPLFYGSKVGVQGCGRRAVYVRVQDHGWVLNSAGQDGSASAPVTDTGK